MRLAAVGMMMAAAAGAWGAETGAPAARSLTVCMDAVAEISMYRVTATAGRIFARVGVRIHWHTIAACPVSPGVIKITFEERTPNTEHPGALAYALPYEGTHIVVFYDRLRECVEGAQLPTLLAYVAVHEITHILQGVCRHSANGIMKAHWDQHDHFAMRTNALIFTAYDEDLLHAGLDKRLTGEKPETPALVASR
jgi:hypothetical protein